MKNGIPVQRGGVGRCLLEKLSRLLVEIRRSFGDRLGHHHHVRRRCPRASRMLLKECFQASNRISEC